MNIGEVIKKYRKQKNMTQEEMANRLGVTAPAVNKWENGVSMPDIMLLAPIARLLDISLDTLLSFQGELTEKEVIELVKEMDKKLENESYESVFQWAKKQMERYPNCERLLLWMTMNLAARRDYMEVQDAEKHEDFFKDKYVRLLESSEEYIRTMAAEALYAFYIQKEEYEKAEEYLRYFSVQNPERKRKQAFLYAHSGRTEEAYKAYEELLYSEYNILNVTFHSIYAMYLKENNLEKAAFLAEKLRLLYRTFDMGEYFEASVMLELAQAKMDVEGTLEYAGRMLHETDSVYVHGKSELYEHLTFKESSEDFQDMLRESVRKLLSDEAEFRYMKGDKRWEELIS